LSFDTLPFLFSEEQIHVIEIIAERSDSPIGNDVPPSVMQLVSNGGMDREPNTLRFGVQQDYARFLLGNILLHRHKGSTQSLALSVGASLAGIRVVTGGIVLPHDARSFVVNARPMVALDQA
jgi:hypothetical protein